MARSKRLRWTLLAAYACVVVYGTLFPLTGWRVPAHFPWRSGVVFAGGVSATDVLANILLYMPLGFLAALGRRVRIIPVVVLVALLLSFCLETLQGFLPGRVTSGLDVAMNVFGTGLGAVAAALVAAVRWPDVAWARAMVVRLRHDRVAWVGIVALLAWGCAQLIPFVPSLSVSNVKAGLKPVWHALQGAGAISVWRGAVYVVATTVLTVTGASALRIVRRGAVAVCCLLVVLPLKVVVVDRQLSPEALVGTCVGVVFGFALWNGGRRFALLVGALLVPVYIVIEALQPGATGAARHAFNWIPLHPQLVQPVNGMANLADAVWPWLALACLCMRAGMRSLWFLLPAVMLLLFGVEWAQTWIPGRYPDITTVLVGTLAWIAATAYAGGPLQRERGTEADEGM